MSVRTWFAKLRYPTPDMGDFAGELPLDKYLADDGNDNLAVGQTKPTAPITTTVPKPKPKPKRKGKK